MVNETNSRLIQTRQEQMLKLVTKSFYKELVNYGIQSRDIVTVSMHLLDHVTDAGKTPTGQEDFFNSLFRIF